MKIHFAKTSSLVALGLMYSSFAFAQSNVPQGAAAQMNLNRLASGGAGGNVQVYDNRYEGMKGSPFFSDQWSTGQVEMKTDNTGKTEVFKDLKLKYDVFSNVLVAVSAQTKDTFQISTAPVVSFSLESPTGEPLPFKRIKEAQTLEPKLRNEFFAVLHESSDGKVAFLKRTAKTKIDANFKGGYSSGQTYDELVNETSYYVVANGKMQRVKLNRKSILEAFPEKEAQLKSFISTQKLAMSTEADLIKTLTYLQTL